MRRVVLAVAGTFALTMMSMQPHLLALGDIGESGVTLTCSDGIEIIETTLVVGPDTLVSLKSAVEAMTLYPAGQVCRLTEPPPLSGSLLGGLIAPAVAFAQPKDFVVGGGRIADCVNFSVSAHSDAANTPGSAKGSITQNRPETCGGPAGFKARVVCLAVSGNMAVVAAEYHASHGTFTPSGHVVAAFADNGNPGPDGPVDGLGFAINVDGPAPTSPPCAPGLPSPDPMSHGNVKVRDVP
jgi:hypothetical protein